MLRRAILAIRSARFPHRAADDSSTPRLLGVFLLIATPSSWAADVPPQDPTTEAPPSGHVPASQTPAQAHEVLTVQEALARGLTQNAALMLSRSAVDVAKANAASTLELEPIVLSMGKKELEDFVLPAQTWKIGLKVTPPNPLVLSARRDAAQAEAQLAAQEVLQTQQEVLAALVWQLETLRMLERERDAARGVLSAQQTLAELAQERTAQALATRVELTMAQLSAAEAEQRVRSLDAKLEQTRQVLKAQLGMEPAQPLTIAWPQHSERSVIDPGAERLVNAALSTRAERAVAELKSKHLAAELRAEQQTVLPFPSSVELVYQLAPLPHSPGFSPWSLGASLEIPIPGYTAPRTQQVRAELAHTQRSEQALQEQLRLEVQAALAEWVEADTVLQAYQQGPLKAASEADAAIKEALQHGDVDLVQATLVQEKTARIRYTAVTLESLSRQKQLLLLAAVGSPIPAEYGVQALAPSALP